jgi:hypothetical protein
MPFSIVGALLPFGAAADVLTLPTTALSILLDQRRASDSGQELLTSGITVAVTPGKSFSGADSAIVFVTEELASQNEANGAILIGCSFDVKASPEHYPNTMNRGGPRGKASLS